MKLRLYILLFLVAYFGSAFAQGISSDGEYEGKFKSVLQESKSESPLTNTSTEFTDSLASSVLKDTLMIDFESRQLTYALFDTVTGKVVWHHQYGELEQYLREMERSVRSRLWHKEVTSGGKEKEKVKKEKGLKFVVPTHLPEWLTRILGDKPPQLSITGKQVISLGGSRSIVGTIDTLGELVDGDTTGDFLFKPESDFSIKGEIGRLLELEIRLKGNIAEKEFWTDAKDDLSEIKVHYRESYAGELEDDIIQEVVIGKTDFRMPGTGLAGYAAGSNEGLFGIKIRSRFGPLDVTTIASIEQMESLKKTISLAAGSNSSARKERDYVKNQFFFLAPQYHTDYLIPGTKSPIVTSAGLIVLEEITSVSSDQIPKYGYINSNGVTEVAAFKELVEDEDYTVDKQYGIINFKRSVRGNTRMGVIVTAGTIERGNDSLIDDVTADGEAIKVFQEVAVLKMPNQKTTDSTYALAMQNAYLMGSSENIEDFSLSIWRVFGDDSVSTIDGASREFTEILGLADTTGALKKGDAKIFNFKDGYFFLPPILNAAPTVNPLQPFTNPELGTSKGVDNTNLDIYVDNASNIEDKYKIYVTSTSRPEGFSIDWGLRSGVIIKSGARTFDEGVDYQIDLGSGYVTLISNDIKVQESLEVEYQKESLFLLEKRVFLGINGMLDLPGVGTNSFFSTTFMWQLMDAKENLVPKVGTEPYNRYLFDSNLKLAFEPQWMTALVNMLPGVSTEQKSQAEFDIEVAHSTVKSSVKGDGEAYIDNFSTAAQTTPLGTSHEGWFRAAPDELRASTATALSHPPAWASYWVEPTQDDGRSYKREIYPNTNGKITDRMSTLRLAVNPLPADASLVADVTLGNDSLAINPWAGITRSLYGDGDLREDRYVEFWIRVPKGKGELFIDLGIVAEDLQLNGKAPNLVRDVESNLVKVPASEDIGVDKEIDTDEKWFYPDFSAGAPSWKELSFGDNRLSNQGDGSMPDYSNDPARDNWQLYNKDNRDNRYYANGTEGNRSRKESPDEEDINNDGGVNRAGATENYFRYRLDLNSLETSPFFDSSQIAENAQSGYTPDPKSDENPTEWKHIRLPISVIDDSLLLGANPYVDSINSPQWTDIQFIRFLWTDFAHTKFDNTQQRLEFEGIQIVGNQWQQVVIDSTSIASVVATTLDSRTTPSYNRPSFKKVEKIANDTVTDYTLNLEFSNIPVSDTAHIVERNLGNSRINLTNYKDVRFWLDKEDSPNYAGGGNPWFVLRMGNSKDNFYEYKTQNPWTSADADSDWDSPKGHVITIDSLTRLKLDWFQIHGEFSGDTLDTTIAYNNGHDSIRVYSANRNYPSLSSISWIAMGVVNMAGPTFFGTVKVNGLRSTGVREYKGWGFRSDIKLSWADFMDNGARANYSDADFRSMTDDVTSAGKTQMSAGFTSKIQLDKFLPPEHGVKIAVGGEISNKMNRPEVVPNSDISLRGADGPDGVKEMVGDFVRQMFARDERGDTTLSERYQDAVVVRTAYTGYHKNNKSKTIPAQLFLDRIDVDYRFNFTESENRKGMVPTSDIPLLDPRYGSTAFHVDETESRKHTVTFEYDFSPDKKVIDVMSFKPFKKSKNRALRKMSFNLLPEILTFDLLKLNYEYRRNYSSILAVQDTTGKYQERSKPVESVIATHNVDVVYKPIAPALTLSYSMIWKRNFDKFLYDDFGASSASLQGANDFWTQGLWQMDDTFRSFGLLKSEQARDQNAKIAFNPDLTRWLTIRTSLGSTYLQNYRDDDTAVYLDGVVTSTFDFSTTFRLRRFFDEWAKRADRIDGALKAMSKGLRAVDFESMTFDYRASMNLQSTYLDSSYMAASLNDNLARYAAYTLGIHNRNFSDVITGNMDDAATFGGVQNRDSSSQTGAKSLNDIRTTNQSIGVRTKLSLPSPIDISFNTLSLAWSRTYRVNFERTKADTSITWPNAKIGATTPLAEKIPLVKTHFRSFKLSSGYSYSKTTGLRGIQNGEIQSGASMVNYDSLNLQTTYRHGFTPLVKMDMQIKKSDLSFNYYTNLMFDSTRAHDEVTVGDAFTRRDPVKQTRVRTVENSWEINYHRDGRKGRTMRIFRDQVIKIDGSTDYGMRVQYTARQHIVNRSGNSGLTEDENYDEWEFSLTPRVTYQVTKNLVTELYYKLTNTLLGASQNYKHNGEIAGVVTFKF